MRTILRLRKNNMEPSAYDIDIPLDNWVPIPKVGRRFFFYHQNVPMFMVVTDISYEMCYDQYEITLWGSYHINIEGQKDEEV